MTKDFNTTILAQEKMLEFRFVRFESPLGGYYQVVVKDLDGRSHFFKMDPVGQEWKIFHCERKPCWICELETQFSDAINSQSN